MNPYHRGGAAAKQDILETLNRMIPSTTAGRERLMDGLPKLSYRELWSLADAFGLLLSGSEWEVGDA